jgi:glycosyltransferase involved in cell wall biosynthesis
VALIVGRERMFQSSGHLQGEAVLERVVFNGRFLTQVQTGVQRYAAETLRALDGLLAADTALRDRFDPVLAVPASADLQRLPLRHIRVARIAGGAGHGWEQGPLWWFARGAYLVNFNYSGPLLKRHQLITVHDATVKVMPGSFKRSYRWVHNLMVAVLGRTARDVMTVSSFSRDELARCFGLARPDILVGREGGEHAVLTADDAAVLRRHGLQAGRFILGVGSVKPNKNYGLLGRAMGLLPDYPLPVAIAGARDIGIFNDDTVLPDGFRFLGFVPDAELSALYRQAAWFVFPSLYEGFGLPAIEAMAHGCPVLAARAASIPEVCGDAALYFDPHDAADLARTLQRVLLEPGLREALRARAPQQLQRYNWRANAQIVLDHLQRRLPGAASDRHPDAGAVPAAPAAAAVAVPPVRT